MLQLSQRESFAKGGNRLCFVHPDHHDRCVKVRRPDFTLADLRRKKGGLKRLLPLRYFDDNREEFDVITDLASRHGEALFEVISRCYGFEPTDMGPGLVLELVRDASGDISQTLKAHIWRQGYTDDCVEAVETFTRRWQELGIPSRDLLLHNILVQKGADGRIRRLVVIDGLGSPNIIPFYAMPAKSRQAKVRRKLDNLHQRIRQTLEKKARGEQPGLHGM